MGKWKTLAFPVPEDSTQDGMELRDYFAAKALQSLIITSETQGYISNLVYVAYQYADAAIDIREHE